MHIEPTQQPMAMGHDPEVDSLAPAAAKEYANASKWLWFLPVRALDAARHLIRTAVEAGQVGPGAKVATPGSDFDGDPTRRPVIIDTAGHRDREDVQRVLNVLRSLGIRDALAYKADQTTRRGEHGDGTAIYTSPVNTIKLIERNPAQTTGRASTSRGRTPATSTSSSVRSEPPRSPPFATCPVVRSAASDVSRP
ncbi:putative phosphothreonine lyase domain-containing protein [Streptomyces alanosinicus]|uniref:Uncharacterized protein n=1 Tax=Streptomyces alanosinicus TaxID=68171 RepID=A0A918YMU2_9ACTN|nr:putative phosphothreonine lyase domain-containg protein [Streptomyces alanosinicus]GHE09066.1 hypothetical protein GCM10010339_60170 [Streptomyces alanosinicus]